MADNPLKITFEFYGKALGLFKPRERNAILAEGIRVAGVSWSVKWLPLRFTNYAKRLGYHVTAKYQKFKNRVMDDPLPLIGPPQQTQAKKKNRKTGEVETYNRERLVVTKDRANVTSTAPGGNPSASVAIPTGHPVAAIVKEVLKKIPENEQADLAKTFAETVTAYINGSSLTAVANGNAPARSALTPAARRSLNIGRKSANRKQTATRGAKVG